MSCSMDSVRDSPVRLSSLKLVDELIRYLATGKQTYLILLDFSKAFDNVNHSKLLHKLRQYGAYGQIVSWIRSFSNRQMPISSCRWYFV